MDFLAATVLRDAGFDAFDNIAGGGTASIPFAAFMAERRTADDLCAQSPRAMAATPASRAP